MKLALFAAAALAALHALTAARADAADGKDVDYDIHTGYFESNKSGLTGDSSYLAFASQKAFDAVFGVARVMGDKQRFLPKDAFDTKLVIAVIKRGKSVYDYKVDKVTNNDGVLTIQYTATPQPPSDKTMFATPLIVSVDKDKYTSVAFVEDGKQVATAKFGE